MDAMAGGGTTRSESVTKVIATPAGIGTALCRDFASI
jgi:hypothetical protein